MRQKRYEKNPELIYLVELYMARNLSDKEAVTELAKKGIEISCRTYQRMKKEIKKIRDEKIANMREIGLPHYVSESIQKLTKVRDTVLKMADDNKNDFWQRLKGYELFIKIQSDLGRYFDSSHDLGEYFKSNSK